MADDLLDNYNPLYDAHLRQYFASPHMRKHLREIGLLQNDEECLVVNENEIYKRHYAMIDMMLKNREAQLAKLVDIQKKLEVAEKIEICRRIRNGMTNPESGRRAKPSRSLSRNRRDINNRRRRSSAGVEDKDLIKKIEREYEEPPIENPSLVYNRLSVKILKYRFLHKLDDKTLSTYMDQLRRQLNKLERFREISFGPHSIARHQGEQHQSWFFRRRSLPTLQTSDQTNNQHASLRPHSKGTKRDKKKDEAVLQKPSKKKDTNSSESVKVPVFPHIVPSDNVKAEIKFVDKEASDEIINAKYSQLRKENPRKTEYLSSEEILSPSVYDDYQKTNENAKLMKENVTFEVHDNEGIKVEYEETEINCEEHGQRIKRKAEICSDDSNRLENISRFGGELNPLFANQEGTNFECEHKNKYNNEKPEVKGYPAIEPDMAIRSFETDEPYVDLQIFKSAGTLIDAEKIAPDDAPHEPISNKAFNEINIMEIPLDDSTSRSETNSLNPNLLVSSESDLLAEIDKTHISHEGDKDVNDDEHALLETSEKYSSHEDQFSNELQVSSETMIEKSILSHSANEEPEFNNDITMYQSHGYTKEQTEIELRVHKAITDETSNKNNDQKFAEVTINDQETKSELNNHIGKKLRKEKECFYGGQFSVQEEQNNDKQQKSEISTVIRGKDGFSDNYMNNSFEFTNNDESLSSQIYENHSNIIDKEEQNGENYLEQNYLAENHTPINNETIVQNVANHHFDQGVNYDTDEKEIKEHSLNLECMNSQFSGDNTKLHGEILLSKDYGHGSNKQKRDFDDESAEEELFDKDRQQQSEGKFYYTTEESRDGMTDHSTTNVDNGLGDGKQENNAVKRTPIHYSNNYKSNNNNERDEDTKQRLLAEVPIKIDISEGCKFNDQNDAISEVKYGTNNQEFLYNNTSTSSEINFPQEICTDPTPQDYKNKTTGDSIEWPEERRIRLSIEAFKNLQAVAEVDIPEINRQNIEILLNDEQSSDKAVGIAKGNSFGFENYHTPSKQPIATSIHSQMQDMEDANANIKNRSDQAVAGEQTADQSNGNSIGN